MLKWNRVIIDKDTMAPFRLGTSKGNLLRAIDCTARTCFLQRPLGSFEKTVVCREVMGLLDIGSYDVNPRQVIFKVNDDTVK